MQFCTNWRQLNSLAGSFLILHLLFSHLSLCHLPVTQIGEKLGTTHTHTHRTTMTEVVQDDPRSEFILRN